MATRDSQDYFPHREHRFEHYYFKKVTLLICNMFLVLDALLMIKSCMGNEPLIALYVGLGILLLFPSVTLNSVRRKALNVASCFSIF